MSVPDIDPFSKVLMNNAVAYWFGEEHGRFFAEKAIHTPKLRHKRG